MDAAGQFAAPEQTLLGSSGQIYPDSMPARRIGNEVVDSARDHYRNFGFASTGRWCFEDMLDQPAPRLFSTHARAQNLPASLTSRGRLIVISRNPKDAIVSAHFFSRKLAAQGGLGEAGADAVAGSMQSTCDAWNATHSEEPEHGAYGDYYTWHQEQAALMSQIGEERATITFYETLQASELTRTHITHTRARAPLRDRETRRHTERERVATRIPFHLSHWKFEEHVICVDNAHRTILTTRLDAWPTSSAYCCRPRSSMR
jgi:hypothetical protein